MSSPERAHRLPADEYRQLLTRYALESHFGGSHKGSSRSQYPSSSRTHSSISSLSSGSSVFSGSNYSGSSRSSEQSVHASEVGYATRKALGAAFGESFDFTDDSYMRLNPGRTTRKPSYEYPRYESKTERDTYRAPQGRDRYMGVPEPYYPPIKTYYAPKPRVHVDPPYYKVPSQCGRKAMPSQAYSKPTPPVPELKSRFSWDSLNSEVEEKPRKSFESRRLGIFKKRSR
jgi:hypothetical protein